MVEQGPKVPFTETDKVYISHLKPKYDALLKAQQGKDEAGVNQLRREIRNYRKMMVETNVDSGSAHNIEEEARRQALEPIRQRNVSSDITSPSDILTVAFLRQGK